MVCKNCKRLLPQQINFCNGCGAKVIKNRLTVRNLFEDFAYRYLNYDNKFLSTFYHLFTKPEAVIGSYIDGTRKKYVNVISYFTIAITLSGFQLYINNKFYPELMDMSAFAQKGSEAFLNNYVEFLKEFQSIIYMLIVPLYAMISKIVFFNIKKYNFTEHLVVNMYSSAHFSILGSVIVLFCMLLSVPLSITEMAIIPLQIIYTAYVFKRIFNLNLKRIILKTMVFLLVLLVTFILLIIAGIVFAIVSKVLTS